MSKPLKQLMVNDLSKRLEGVSELLVISTVGMTANDAVKFRAALRQKNVRAMVVKNATCARVFQDRGMAYASALLEGPTTVVFGGESLIDAAKALVEVAKSFKLVKIRGGAAEGAVINAADVEVLSKLPGREQLIGMVIGGLLSTASGVVGALTAPASQIASQIEKLSERPEAEVQAA